MRIHSDLKLSSNTAWKRVVRKTTQLEPVKIDIKDEILQKSETSSSIDHYDGPCCINSSDRYKLSIPSNDFALLIHKNNKCETPDCEMQIIQDLNSIVARLNQFSIAEETQAENTSIGFQKIFKVTRVKKEHKNINCQNSEGNEEYLSEEIDYPDNFTKPIFLIQRFSKEKCNTFRNNSALKFEPCEQIKFYKIFKIQKGRKFIESVDSESYLSSDICEDTKKINRLYFRIERFKRVQNLKPKLPSELNKIPLMTSIHQDTLICKIEDYFTYMCEKMRSKLLLSTLKIITPTLDGPFDHIKISDELKFSLLCKLMRESATQDSKIKYPKCIKTIGSTID